MMGSLRLLPPCDAVCAVEGVYRRRKKAAECSCQGHGRVEDCVTSPEERTGIPAAYYGASDWSVDAMFASYKHHSHQ